MSPVRPIAGTEVNQANKYSNQSKKAMKYSPGHELISREACNNPLLNQRSEIFEDDVYDRIDKRCFFLIAGQISSDPGIEINLKVNALADPGTKMRVTASVQINNVIIEYCNEILKTLSVISFNHMSLIRIGDMVPAPSDDIDKHIFGIEKRL
jgi:hypothetical protein